MLLRQLLMGKFQVLRSQSSKARVVVWRFGGDSQPWKARNQTMMVHPNISQHRLVNNHYWSSGEWNFAFWLGLSCQCLSAAAQGNFGEHALSVIVHIHTWSSQIYPNIWLDPFISDIAWIGWSGWIVVHVKNPRILHHPQDQKITGPINHPEKTWGLRKWGWIYNWWNCAAGLWQLCHAPSGSEPGTGRWNIQLGGWSQSTILMIED